MAHTCWIWRLRLGRSTLAPMMGLFIQYLRVSWQNVGSRRLRHHNVSFEQNLRSWSPGMALQYIRPSEDPTHAQLWPGRGVERWHESKSNEKQWIKLKSRIIANPEMPWAQGHMLFWEWIVRLSEMTPASDGRQSVMFHSYFKSLNEQNSWRKFRQVLFGSGNGIFYALSERLGTPNWQFDVGSPIYTSASVHRGGQGCLGVLGSEMRSRKQGIEIWGSQEATPCSRAHQSSTVPNSGFVYFGSENGKMYALNELTGALIWTYDAFSPIRSPKVLRSISDLIFKHGFCKDVLAWPWYDRLWQ